MNNIKIPSIQECFDLMNKYHMLPNIQEHSKKVMQVALGITRYLEPSLKINNNLIQAAALLHDITKTDSLESGKSHDISGKKLLTELGYPEIGEIISEHVHLKNFDVQRTLEEKEIIFYADKRVMHDKIVSTEERIQDLINRYSHIPKSRFYINKTSEQLKLLELKLNRYLTIDLNTIMQDLL